MKMTTFLLVVITALVASILYMDILQHKIFVDTCRRLANPVTVSINQK